ncbi:unnamed protein product [Rangifer tarandus platyrhynchus]|uniref:Uncharacterized protein n=1 Tax=Rangifer tarandus platyrhynchus TaxID=3082113 RepID=A0ABN8ZCL9_RANTA|nr:unnamed protein product [Rangifer tarandus platyrhynchus]
MGWPAGSSGRLTLDKTRSARQGRHPPHSTFSSSGRVQVTPSQEKAQSAGMAGPAKAGASWRCVQVRSQADAGIVTTGSPGGAAARAGTDPDSRAEANRRPEGPGLPERRRAQWGACRGPSEQAERVWMSASLRTPVGDGATADGPPPGRGLARRGNPPRFVPRPRPWEVGESQ